MKAFEAYIFVGRKILYLRICESWVRITQKNDPQMANPQTATFCGRSPKLKIFKSANLLICDLRNLFTDRPPLKGGHNTLCLILVKYTCEL
jgi:hypothetical protein